MLQFSVICIVCAVFAPSEGNALTGVKSNESNVFCHFNESQGSFFSQLHNVGTNESYSTEKKTLNRSSNFFYKHITNQYENKKNSYCSFKENLSKRKKKNFKSMFNYQFKTRNLLWKENNLENSMSFSKPIKQKNWKKKKRSVKLNAKKNSNASSEERKNLLKNKNEKSKRRKRKMSQDHLDDIAHRTLFKFSDKPKKEVEVKNSLLENNAQLSQDLKSALSDKVSKSKTSNTEKLSNLFPVLRDVMYDNQFNNEKLKIVNLKQKNFKRRQDDHIKAKKSFLEKPRFKRKTFSRYLTSKPDQSYLKPSAAEQFLIYTHPKVEKDADSLQAKKFSEKVNNKRQSRISQKNSPTENEPRLKKSFFGTSDSSYLKKRNSVSAKNFNQNSKVNVLKSDNERNTLKRNKKKIVKKTILPKGFRHKKPKLQERRYVPLFQESKTPILGPSGAPEFINYNNLHNFENTLEKPPLQNGEMDRNLKSFYTPSKISGKENILKGSEQKLKELLYSGYDLSPNRYLQLRHDLRNYAAFNHLMRPLKRSFRYDRRKRGGCKHANKCKKEKCKEEKEKCKPQASQKCWRSAPLLCIPYIRKGQDELLKYLIKSLQKMLGKPIPQKVDIFDKTKFKPCERGREEENHECEETTEKCECTPTSPRTTCTTCPTPETPPPPVQTFPTEPQSSLCCTTTTCRPTTPCRPTPSCRTSPACRPSSSCRPPPPCNPTPPCRTTPPCPPPTCRPLPPCHPTPCNTPQPCDHGPPCGHPNPCGPSCGPSCNHGPSCGPSCGHGPCGHTPPCGNPQPCGHGPSCGHSSCGHTPFPCSHRPSCGRSHSGGRSHACGRTHSCGRGHSCGQDHSCGDPSCGQTPCDHTPPCDPCGNCDNTTPCGHTPFPCSHTPCNHTPRPCNSRCSTTPHPCPSTPRPCPTTPHPCPPTPNCCINIPSTCPPTTRSCTTPCPPTTCAQIFTAPSPCSPTCGSHRPYPTAPPCSPNAILSCSPTSPHCSSTCKSCQVPHSFPSCQPKPLKAKNMCCSNKHATTSYPCQMNYPDADNPSTSCWQMSGTGEETPPTVLTPGFSQPFYSTNAQPTDEISSATVNSEILPNLPFPRSSIPVTQSIEEVSATVQGDSSTIKAYSWYEKPYDEAEYFSFTAGPYTVFPNYPADFQKTLNSNEDFSPEFQPVTETNDNQVSDQSTAYNQMCPSSIESCSLNQIQTQNPFSASRSMDAENEIGLKPKTFRHRLKNVFDIDKSKAELERAKKIYKLSEQLNRNNFVKGPLSLRSRNFLTSERGALGQDLNNDFLQQKLLKNRRHKGLSKLNYKYPAPDYFYDYLFTKYPLMKIPEKKRFKSSRNSVPLKNNKNWSLKKEKLKNPQRQKREIRFKPLSEKEDEFKNNYNYDDSVDFPDLSPSLDGGSSNEEDSTPFSYELFSELAKAITQTDDFEQTNGNKNEKTTTESLSSTKSAMKTRQDTEATKETIISTDSSPSSLSTTTVLSNSLTCLPCSTCSTCATCSTPTTTTTSTTPSTTTTSTTPSTTTTSTTPSTTTTSTTPSTTTTSTTPSTTTTSTTPSTTTSTTPSTTTTTTETTTTTTTTEPTTTTTTTETTTTTTTTEPPTTTTTTTTTTTPSTTTTTPSTTTTTTTPSTTTTTTTPSTTTTTTTPSTTTTTPSTTTTTTMTPTTTTTTTPTTTTTTTPTATTSVTTFSTFSFSKPPISVTTTTPFVETTIIIKDIVATDRPKMHTVNSKTSIDFENNTESSQGKDSDDVVIPTTLKMASIVKGQRKQFSKPAPKTYSRVYPDSLPMETEIYEEPLTTESLKSTAENTKVFISSAAPDVRLQLLAVCEGYLEVMKMMKSLNHSAEEEVDTDLSHYCENIISNSFSEGNTSVKFKKFDSNVTNPTASLDSESLGSFRRADANYKSSVKVANVFVPTKDLFEKKYRGRAFLKGYANSVHKRELKGKIKIKRGVLEKTSGKRKKLKVLTNIRKRRNKRNKDVEDESRQEIDKELLKKGVPQEQVELLSLLKKRKRALLSWLFNPKRQVNLRDVRETEYVEDEESLTPYAQLVEDSGTPKLKRNENSSEPSSTEKSFTNDTIFPVYAKQYGYDRGGELREVEVLWRKINETTHEKQVFKNQSVIALLLTSTNPTNTKDDDLSVIEPIQEDSASSNEDMEVNTNFIDEIPISYDDPNITYTSTPATIEATAASASATTDSLSFISSSTFFAIVIKGSSTTKHHGKSKTFTFVKKPDKSSIVGSPPNSTTAHPNITQKVIHKLGAAKDVVQEYTIEFLNYSVYILPAMFTLLFLFCCLCCFFKAFKKKNAIGGKHKKKKKKKTETSTEEESETDTTQDSEKEVKKKRRESKRKKHSKNEKNNDDFNLDKKRSKAFWSVLKRKGNPDYPEENNTQTEKKKSFLRFLKGKKDEQNKAQENHPTLYTPLNEMHEQQNYERNKQKEYNEMDNNYEMHNNEIVKMEENQNMTETTRIDNNEAKERRELIALLEELKKIETEQTNNAYKKEQKSVQVQFMTQDHSNNPNFLCPFTKNFYFPKPKHFPFCKHFPVPDGSPIRNYELYDDMGEYTELLPNECGCYSEKNNCLRHPDFRINKNGKCERFLKIFRDTDLAQSNQISREKKFMGCEDTSYIFDKYKSSDSRTEYIQKTYKNPDSNICINDDMFETSPFITHQKKKSEIIDEMENFKRQLNKKKYVRLKDDGVLCRL